MRDEKPYRAADAADAEADQRSRPLIQAYARSEPMHIDPPLEVTQFPSRVILCSDVFTSPAPKPAPHMTFPSHSPLQSIYIERGLPSFDLAAVPGQDVG